MERYVLIENIERPVLIKLDEDWHKDGYIIFRKRNLYKLPKQVKKYLIKNGLYKSIESANNSHDNLFNLHRLVLCLYVNIVGYIVHHIENNVNINNISNLVRVTQAKHDEIELLGLDAGKKESYREQKRLCKLKRKTLAEDEELVLKILKLRGLKDES